MQAFIAVTVEVALERLAEQTVSQTGPPDTEDKSVRLCGNSGGTTERFRPEPIRFRAFFFI